MAAIAVGLASLLPVVYLFIAGFSWGAIVQLFTLPATLPTIVRTVGLTVAVAALCSALGVGTAMLVVRTNLPFRKLFTVLFAMPLAIPGFVSAYAAYSLGLLAAPNSHALSSFAGAAVVNSLTLYPYVFLPCVVALAGVDARQTEVVRNLRASRFEVFRHAVFPQLRPALSGGVLIVALHTLAEYGAMFQLSQRTLTTTIMTEVIDYGHYRSARSLSLLLALLASAVLFGSRLLTGRRFPAAASAHTVKPTSPLRLRRWTPLVTLGALIIPTIAVGPTVAMTIRGLMLTTTGTTTTWATVLTSAGQTFWYATAAALVGSVAALPVSWWISRRPSVTASLTERSTWIAHSMPNAILAFSLVFLSTRLIPDLYKTPAMLIIAYVMLFLPLAISNQRVGLRSVMIAYEDVASSLGIRPVNRFLRISLPLAFPGIATGALLVALDASKELTTTLMLLPFGTQTLSTGLWATNRGESLDFAAAAPYALMLVTLGAIPVSLIARRTLRFIHAPQ